MDKRGLLGKFFFLILIATMIVVPILADFEKELYVQIVGAIILVLWVLFLWFRGRKRKKMMRAGYGFGRPGLGDAQIRPRLNTAAIKAISKRREKEKANIKAGRAMEMRAMRDLKRGAA